MSGRSGGDLTTLAEAFRGVTVTIATPFAPSTLDLDLAGLRRNLQFLARSSVSVIVPGGNTGEYQSLTVEELRTLTEATIREVASAKPVVMGVGGDLRTAIALAQFAQHAGAQGVLIHEPTHTFASDEGLFEYYQQLCRATTAGIAIYKRTPRLRDDLIVRLTHACPNVVAVKYAWTDVAAFSSMTTDVPSRVTCACGSAERWALPFSSAGATGFTSGIANFAPEHSHRFWKALQVDPPTARSMWREFAALEEVRSRGDSAFNVPVIKHAMDLVGLAAGPPRPPLAPLTKELETAVQEILQRWQLLHSVISPAASDIQTDRAS